MKFTLENPKVEGDIKTEFKCDSALAAAKAAYASISKYFINSVDNFKFTLQSGGEFYHFNVEEKINKDNVDFVITPFKSEVNIDLLKHGKSALKKQSGGKKRHHRKYDDEDDSSESSDSFYYRRVRFPINTWYYNPFVYVLDDSISVISTPSVVANTSLIYVPGGIAPFYHVTLNSKPANNTASTQTATSTGTP